jgi:hypothetical protein
MAHTVKDVHTSAQWLQFQGARFVYDPYPIGVVANTFAPPVYEALVDSWPAQELFHFKPN